jgi:hypothetical protein
MRTSAMLTAVTLLLGGCAVVTSPPATVRPASLPARAEAPPERSASATPPPRATPRRPQAVRIDNASIESFRASWERLRSTLSPAQQAALNDAVVELTFARYGGATNIPGNLRSSPIVPEMIRDRIAGLTYAEIIALSP